MLRIHAEGMWHGWDFIVIIFYYLYSELPMFFRFPWVMLRHVTLSYTIMHSAVKMVNRCSNVLVRARNNAKELIIAVLRFGFLLIVEVLNLYNACFMSKRALRLLLIAIIHGKGEFSRVGYSRRTSIHEQPLVEGGQHPSLVFFIDLSITGHHDRKTLRCY